MTFNRTQFSIEYPAQFEQATLRVHKVGQPDVWTETFANSSKISGDLTVLLGGVVADGVYRYEIAVAWPDRPAQAVAGMFRIVGGAIQRESSGPTPQADSFVDGSLRVSGAGCFGCTSGTALYDADFVGLDIYNTNVGATVAETAYIVTADGSTSVVEVGNQLGDFFVALPSTFMAITWDTGNLGLGTFPVGELHIAKPSTNVDFFLERTGTNPVAALLSAQADLVAFGTISNDPFVIATNNTNRIFIGGGGGVTVTGNFSVAGGTKKFVEDHPTDPTKSIYYASIEGGEAGTYIRGSATLVKGQAVIDLPEHFGLVTADEGLTVQLTPRGEWLQAYVAEATPRRLVLRARGGKSGRIDYLVIGVRKGYTDYQVIRSKADGAK